MKKMALVLHFPLLIVALGVAACGSSAQPQAQSPSDATGNTSATVPAAPAAPTAGVANEGQTCGDGTFGRPNISCAAGLTCVYSGAVSSGPAGSSSMLPGKCQKQ
jgi:hypothetical protein